MDMNEIEFDSEGKNNREVILLQAPQHHTQWKPATEYTKGCF